MTTRRAVRMKDALVKFYGYVIADLADGTTDPTYHGNPLIWNTEEDASDYMNEHPRVMRQRIARVEVREIPARRRKGKA